MRILNLAVLFLIFFSYQPSYASHLMGADISYKHIGNDKYDVTVRFYRDCRGIPFNGPTMQIRCIKGATTTVTPSSSLYSIRDISPTCASYGKKCSPQNTVVSSSIPILEEHTYKYTYDFSTLKKNGCCTIEIGAGQCCRNGSITTGAAGNNFWVTAELNLCFPGGNNSPVMYTESRAIFPCNQPVYYNMGAKDYADNDSLVYELTDPMQSTSQKTSWNSGFSSSNPITSYCVGSCTPAIPNAYPPRGFYLNRFTGDLIFTPTNCDETSNCAIKVTEYRKDSTGNYVKVGHVIRDQQIIIVNSAGNNTPQIIGQNTIFMPDSSEMVSSFDTYDEPFKGPVSTFYNDTLTLKMIAGPVSLQDTTFKVNNPGNKHPGGTFRWKPMGMARNLPYSLLLEVTDNACAHNMSTVKNVYVHVRKRSELAWVEGTLYHDVNLNCKWDSTEAVLPNAWVTAFNDPSIIFRSDSTGKYKGWFRAGTANFKLGGEFTSFICNQNVNLRNDTINTVNIGGINKFMKLSGSVYVDTIHNCKFDSIEPVIANHMIYTEPGKFAAISDSSGYWEMNIPAGVYEIHSTPPKYSKIECPKNAPVASIYTDSVIRNLNLSVKDTSMNVTDLSINLIISSTLRRGFNNGSVLVVKNLTSKTVNKAVARIRFNKNLIFDSKLSSKYDYKDDSTLEFKISNLAAKRSQSFKIYWYVDPKLNKANEYVEFVASLDTLGLSQDPDLSDNSDRRICKIVAAKDPNFKEEVSKNGYAWREGNTLRYHVQFQNTGTDTAVNVVVIDTLPPHLLPHTLKIVGSSHHAEYSLNSNVLKVTFPNIYLPDSATNENESKGSFEFSINIQTGLDQETRFYNKVEIYFDFEKPVTTAKEYVTFTSFVNTMQPDAALYCPGDSLVVGYTSNFSFNTGNVFKLILSDPLGNFDAGTIELDSVLSIIPYGNFRTIIPSTLVSGNQYRLKVVSTNSYGSILKDGVSGYFSINPKPKKIIFTSEKSLYCGNDSVDFKLEFASGWVKILDQGKTLDSVLNKKTMKLKLSMGKHELLAFTENKGRCIAISDTLLLITDIPPVMKLSSPSHPDLKVCENDTVDLVVSGTSTYDLLGNSGSFIGTFNTPLIKTAFYTNNEIRQVRGTSLYGCSDTSISLKFRRFNNPVVSLLVSETDLEFCEGTLITFSGKGALNYQLYKNDLPWLTSFQGSVQSNDVKDSERIYVHGTDLNSCTSVSPSIVMKVNPLPNISFTVNNVCEGDSVRFLNTSKDALDYTWSFGDGYASNEVDPTHFYKISVSSTFNVSLKGISAKSCKDSIVRPVTVNANPDADFTYEIIGNQVVFIAKQIDHSSYRWYFGNGDSSVGTNSKVSYYYSGTPEGLKVCLSATNAANCSAESCQVLKKEPVSVIQNTTSLFNVYPNPNDGFLNIVSDSKLIGSEYALFNLIGERVASGKIESSRQSLDMTNMNQGIYVLKVGTSEPVKILKK
ncbi:MAG: T9SS type A sorting domain-containing protein [Flavobacteriales bacterium]|nr:T9SS type A sorting domain-containing protein [Flavobacteriales bacterium]